MSRGPTVARVPFDSIRLFRESFRQGVGSWLVRQLCGLARARGQIAAARCSVENEASRRTLLRGGMDEVGQILVADVRA